ncbi:MAG: ClpX C4-type zinc finger protein [Pseudomonadota bacterium]
MKPATQRVYCSFCGLSDEQVRLMIAGIMNDVVICDACITLSVEAYLLPKGLIHLSGPRRMLAADIGVTA